MLTLFDEILRKGAPDAADNLVIYPSDYYRKT